MVVMSDPSIPSAATLINIRNARKHFEKLERVDGPATASLCVEYCQNALSENAQLPFPPPFFSNIHNVVCL